MTIIKHVTIVEDNCVTGIRYGTVDVEIPESNAIMPHYMHNFNATQQQIRRVFAHKNTKHK